MILRDLIKDMLDQEPESKPVIFIGGKCYAISGVTEVEPPRNGCGGKVALTLFRDVSTTILEPTAAAE